jgi:hypothetical protein
MSDEVRSAYGTGSLSVILLYFRFGNTASAAIVAAASELEVFVRPGNSLCWRLASS